MLSPTRAVGSLAPRDAALARLDVLPTIDGIEPGLWEIGRLEAEGVRVFNGRHALLTTHDKLQTSHVLSAAAFPIHARRMSALPGRRGARASVVVKPRFGSSGRDVCSARTGLR